MMGEIFKKPLYWCFDFKILEKVPNGAKNNQTNGCFDKITF